MALRKLTDRLEININPKAWSVEYGIAGTVKHRSRRKHLVG